MTYEFIIDAVRKDASAIEAGIRQHIEEEHLTGEARFYYAKSRGDAERHVRMSVFLLPKEEIRFIACGDLTGQVAAGLVGAQENKSMAILDCGITDDVLKSFPGRDFKDFHKMICGEVLHADMIKVGDDYSLNICTAGLSAIMAKASREYSTIGLANKKAYRRGLLKAMLHGRRNWIAVTADGKRLNGNRLLNVSIAGGQWCGTKYHAAPEAVMDDGLLDVCVLDCVPLARITKSFKMFETGDYNSTAFARRHATTCRAKHIELDSEQLIFVTFDGEISASTHFDIDVLPKAVKLILPAK